MVNTEFKEAIREGLHERLKNFSSANKMAVSLGLSPAQLSRFLNGELDNVISDANLISIARKLDIQFGKKMV